MSANNALNSASIDTTSSIVHSRRHHLVSAAWLDSLIAGEPVSHPPAPNWRLFEVGYEHGLLFEEAHIPGAVYIDTLEIESPPVWNKVDDAIFLEFLLSLGITSTTSAILYGRNVLAPARLAHLLLYAGVADVRLLDGGFAAWQNSATKHAIEHGRVIQPWEPTRAFGATSYPRHPEYLSSIGDARDILAHPHDSLLVSIRSRTEFMGRTSGYASIPARGDIAGAVWGQAGRDGDVNSMSAYHQPDGTAKPMADIAAQWSLNGIVAEKRVAFYCGTGWRASLAFFYAWVMGWSRVSVYDGGWMEWSADPRNPIIRRDLIATEKEKPAGVVSEGACGRKEGPKGVAPSGLDRDGVPASREGVVSAAVSPALALPLVDASTCEACAKKAAKPNVCG